MTTKERVGLIQVDGVMPNLALLKLSKWVKDQDHEPVFVDLSTLGIDKWFASKIFVGGSGYDLQAKLPETIEVLTPDYESFNMDHSVVFTSRGCPNKCVFCIVHPKEGDIKEIENFKKDIKHSKVIVMDNNFLRSPLWKEKLWYFIDNRIKVCFNQGFDIRVIDDEKAAMLAMINYQSLNFKARRLYFAFDNIKLEPIFREKISILLKYIKNPKHIMVYMLVGFKDSTFDDAMERFNIIRSYGCDPYVMLFHKNNKKLNHFARWVNKRRYTVVPDFNDYKR